MGGEEAGPEQETAQRLLEDTRFDGGTENKTLITV